MVEDELADNSDDEKRMYRAELRAGGSVRQLNNSLRREPVQELVLPDTWYIGVTIWRYSKSASCTSYLDTVRER